jgi:hypothetical protein
MPDTTTKPRLRDKNGKIYSDLNEVDPPLKINNPDDYLSPAGLLEDFYYITDTLLWDEKALSKSDKILRLLYPIFQEGDYTGYDQIGGWRMYFDSDAWVSYNWGALKRDPTWESEDLDSFLEDDPLCIPTCIPVSFLASFIVVYGRLPSLREAWLLAWKHRNPEFVNTL